MSSFSMDRSTSVNMSGPAFDQFVALSVVSAVLDFTAAGKIFPGLSARSSFASFRADVDSALRVEFSKIRGLVPPSFTVETARQHVLRGTAASLREMVARR